jgi:hypothetical protein
MFQKAKKTVTYFVQRSKAVVEATGAYSPDGSLPLTT